MIREGIIGGGSSPLARGLHPNEGAVRVIDGIIPARAGFTDVASFKTLSPTDHPRSRGVYAPTVFVPVRVWGIIPARAGFTRSAS